MDEIIAAMDYPTLILPKTCTTLETNCENSDNVFMRLNITTPDTEGITSHLYDGFCNVKLIDSYDEQGEIERMRVISPAIEANDIEQMPIILSEDHLSYLYNESQVWIDPSRSPYVYNHYNIEPPERFAYRENHITVEQHNTFITQNVYTTKDQSPVRRRNRKDTHKPIHNEEDYDSFLTEVLTQEERYHREPEPKSPKHLEHENSALIQLMTTDVKKKQRKTILFLGNNSNLGQTIQNISYNDPMVTCAEANMQVTIESSRKKPSKKIYQCDKCKQIFNTISAFREHMVGSYSKTKSKTESFLCIECGRNLKTEAKFEKHVLGHGNPDLECPKCHKVYATKATLKAHQKLHNRKYHCNYCTRTFEKLDGLKKHIKKAHSLYICNQDKCEFMTENAAEFKEHKNQHQDKCDGLYEGQEVVGEVVVITEEDLKSEYLNDRESHVSDSDNNNDSMISSKVFFDDDDNVSQDIIEEVYQPDDLNATDDRPTRNSKKKQVNSTETGIENEENDDSVLEKVMSNKLFLLNSKMARKSRCNKTCEVCYKTFDRIADLKRHLIEHIIRYTLLKSPVCKNGILKMVCAVCQSVAFSELNKYKDHLREHAKLTLYKCTICDKSFSDSSNFSKHKKIHGAAHFQCDLCHRKFNSKKMITQHMEYHMKNDPVKCKFCHKKFHFASMLNKHVKSNHAKSSKAKYSCKFCEEYFVSLKDKWDHEWRVHSIRKNVFDCERCDYKFRKYSELKRHCFDLHNANIPTSSSFKKRGRR